MRPHIDIQERAVDAIGRLTTIGPALLRPLPDGEEGVTIRPAPPTTTMTYMDGTQDVSYLLDVYVRRAREDVAYEQAQAASWALQADGLASANGSYEISGVSEYAGTTEVGSTSDGMHAVMVGIVAYLTIRP